MSDAPRRRSPRAPSIALDEAIERVAKVYEKERRHAAPVDVIAQDLGYKNANNGAALTILASLRYYGLLERPQEGQLAVSKEVEEYQYAPSDDIRRNLLIKWLRTPPLYSDLLEKFRDGLPSDANLRFELIQRRFNPDSAGSAITAFKRSVEFARFFENPPTDLGSDQSANSPSSSESLETSPTDHASELPIRTAPEPSVSEIEDSMVDRIPVRLPGGRRAWLMIPTPFYSDDKDRLKAQIDLLLTEDESH